MVYDGFMVEPVENDVDFGFRRVGENEKQALVNEVFSKAAERYDQMNDLISGGFAPVLERRSGHHAQPAAKTGFL